MSWNYCLQPFGQSLSKEYISSAGPYWLAKVGENGVFSLEEGGSCW